LPVLGGTFVFRRPDETVGRRFAWHHASVAPVPWTLTDIKV
jgi:hypothetical protein